MQDFATQRLNMVESQVRTSEVIDHKLLKIMLDLPRERFVPDAFKPLAYAGDGVPLAPGRTGRALPAPVVTAKLLQLAEIKPTDKVLEIGCASGYATAIIARLAASVVGLDSDAALTGLAADALKAEGLANAKLETGPLEAGASAGAPYDVIVVSGSVPDVCDSWREQLRDGGRLVAVLLQGAVGKATLFEKRGASFTSRFGFDAAAPALPGLAKKPVFAL